MPCVYLVLPYALTSRWTSITRVLSTASSTLFALGTLRSKGLPTATLHQIARATTLNSIMYASPAWWGYCNTQNRDIIEALLCRMKRRGFLHKDDPSACDLAIKADLALFRAISTNPNHVLHNYLPCPKQHKYHLRARVHNFTLPLKDDRNFIPRSLYRNIY